MRQIDLLRHGETERKGVLLGRTDAVLSELGWQQFEKQTRNREYCIILTSPLKRAREPAEQLANARNASLCSAAERQLSHQIEALRSVAKETQAK